MEKDFTTRPKIGIADSDSVALAERTAAAMCAHDAASRLLGLRLVSVRPGYARLSMRVRPDLLNSHRVCHGGFLFTLADAAFAYACNSYNHNTVASACHIDFLAPAEEGAELEVECEERSLAGRTGVYDATIRGLDGKIIALFRGKSYRVAGKVIAALEDDAHRTTSIDTPVELIEGIEQ